MNRPKLFAIILDCGSARWHANAFAPDPIAAADVLVDRLAIDFRPAEYGYSVRVFETGSRRKTPVYHLTVEVER